MKIAVYTRNKALVESPAFTRLEERLAQAGHELYPISFANDIVEGTDMLLSVGGDGTFLSASKRVGSTGIPVLGVNLGRLGFLSEYTPDEVGDAIVSGEYTIEDRALLETKVEGEVLEEGSSFSPYTLNEISVHRFGAAILGIDVRIDGSKLPTYWADGLLIATSSGSTAYSLSVGGPICTPDAKVLIISPIAPHNLNVRPLIVPDTTKIEISMKSRSDSVMMSMDNRTVRVAKDSILTVGVAQFSLKRVRLEKSNFVKALTTKLFWGEDIRNGSDQ